MGKLNLKISSKAFTTASEKLEEFGEDVTLDPGRYNGQITDVRSPKAGLVIIDIKEEESGGRVSIIFSTDEEKLVWLLGALKKFGLAPTSGDEVVEALEELKNAKPTVLFSVKEKDGYSNTRIEKMIGEGDDNSAVDEDAGDASAGAAKNSPKEKAGKASPAKVKAKVKVEEEEEEEVEEEEAVVEDEPVAEEEEVEIKPGLKLKATIQGEEGVKCEIVEVFEADGKVTVKRTSDGKKFKIPVDRLSL